MESRVLRRGCIPSMVKQVAIALAFLVSVALPSPTSALEAVYSQTAPTDTSFSKATGLRVQLSCGAVGEYGYHRAAFTLTSVNPAIGDRSITIRVYADRGYNTYGSRYDLAVEKDVDFPAGSKDVSVDVSIPMLHRWGLLRWEVWVDGVKDQSLGGIAPPQFSNEQAAVRLLAPFGGDENPRSYLADNSAAGDAQHGAQIQINQVAYSQSSLPDDWRLLEPYNGVVLSVSELVDLQQNQPAEYAALVTWVRAGGVLVVEQTGADFEGLETVDQQLGISHQPIDPKLARGGNKSTSSSTSEQPAAKQAADTPFSEFPTWDWPTIEVRQASLNEIIQGQRAPQPQVSTARTEGWFLRAPLGFGEVLAFAGGFRDDPPQGQTGGGRGLRDVLAESLRGFEQLASQLSQAGGTPSMLASDGLPTDPVLRYLSAKRWVPRHGMAPDAGAPEFSEWLIPGVGAAPVDAFRWLITLFVLLVGPATFWVLRAYHRTYLLAIIAPAAAALFTICLFGYAFISDGLGLRVRVQSVTLLDRRSKQAVSWSRQSYYAGLAPAEGLRFPAATAVYPIMAPWQAQEADSGDAMMREIVESPEQTQYSEGWLRSRETSQMLLVDVASTEAGLDVEYTSDGVRIHNRLGVDLSYVVLKDLAGEWWEAESVGQGSAGMKRADRLASIGRVRQIFSDAAPAAPIGSASDSNYSTMRPTNGWLYSVNELVSFSDSALSRMMLKLQGLDEGEPIPLKAGAFMALSTEASVAPVGDPNANELGSFHVVVGEANQL